MKRNKEEILVEYDFSKGIRGKYAKRYAQGANFSIMNKNIIKDEISPVHRDTLKRIQEDPEFAEAYFEELRSSPIPVQLAILRRLNPDFAL